MRKISYPKKNDRNNLYLVRKSKIYSKALDLFVKNGYDAASMSMIADALGMSKANLYYYFSSKEDLLYQIHLDDLKRRFIPIIEEAERLPDPEARILLFFKKLTLHQASNNTGRVLIHEINCLSKRHQNEIRMIWNRAYELIREAIKGLQQLGRARTFRESFLTFLVFGMSFWTIYWWDYRRKSNGEELAETLIQIFLHGLLYPVNEKGAEYSGQF